MPGTASPATRGRPRRSTADTREMRGRIMASARRLFAADGYEGVSMRRLATDAGCAPAALYAYFPSKRAVLHVLWEEIFRDLADDMTKAAKAGRDPVKRLETLTRTMMTFWLERPDDFRAIFLIEDRPQRPGDAYFAHSPVSLETAAILVKAARAAIDTGRMALTDADRISHLLLTGVLGTALSLITIPELDWGRSGALADDMAKTLIRGLQKA